jgi:hypothetical protein
MKRAAVKKPEPAAEQDRKYGEVAHINQRLAAFRRLGYEAADSGLLSPERVAGISCVDERIGDDVPVEDSLSPFRGFASILDKSGPDDKTNRGTQDRSRINVHEEYEMRDWSKRLVVTPEKKRPLRESVHPRMQSESILGNTLFRNWAQV